MTGEDRTLASDTGRNNNEIYRFRALDKLLDCGFQELERQTIYFATPDELNDPLESIREMHWIHSDKKVWRMVFADFLKWFDSQEVYGKGENTTPSSVNKGFDIQSRKIERVNIDRKVISHLTRTRRSLSKNEMRYVLHNVYTNLLAARNISGYSSIDFQLDEYFQALEVLESREDTTSQKHIDLLHARNSTALILNYKRESIDRGFSEENIDLTYVPELFLNYCERSIFPNYYVACFSSTYSDPTMWSHYANGHSGACLILGTTSKANGRYLGDAKSTCDNKHYFREVKYRQVLEPIDVLDAISVLRRFRNCLLLPDNLRAWPQIFLHEFRDRIITKTAEWQRECEFRLIWEDLDRDRNQANYIELSQRQMHYEFDTLKGIIFGVKTTDMDKLRVMEVINRKCSEQQRSNFKYYQAYVDQGRIEKHEILFEGL